MTNTATSIRSSICSRQGADYAQMKKVAEALRQRLLKVKDVTKVNLYGTQDEKIYVEFSHAKLATLGITTDQIFQSLARQNAVVPAGTVESAAQRVPLRVTGAFDGAKAVAETPVQANGRVFRLGDIATVTTALPIRLILLSGRKTSLPSASGL
jgi:Cation/multidrug efflux pump